MRRDRGRLWWFLREARPLSPVPNRIKIRTKVFAMCSHSLFLSFTPAVRYHPERDILQKRCHHRHPNIDTELETATAVKMESTGKVTTTATFTIKRNACTKNNTIQKTTPISPKPQPMAFFTPPNHGTLHTSVEAFVAFNALKPHGCIEFDTEKRHETAAGAL